MQRKVFRVEQMLGSRVAVRPLDAAKHAAQPVRAERPATDDGKLPALKRELALLADAIVRHKRELAALMGDGNERRMTRAAGELGAAIEGMEKATVKILQSTEVIDDSARALAASLKAGYEHGLAQDIQEQAVKIYEACNFQDLGGQRIGNVIATLNMIEDRVAGMLERDKGQPGAAEGKPAPRPELLNGPRLDGASGHTSQRDIDKMFG